MNTHDSDFYNWTQEQATLLRTGRIAELDIDNLIDEIEDMGRSEKRELENRLSLLLAHLLKWQYQITHRGKSWHATIKEQRLSLLELLADNPSLRHILAERTANAYQHGILQAVRETGIDENDFSARCPYTITEILDLAFYPH